MNHDGTRRPEEIQAEIERTRREMDSTLGALEQRLTPGQLVDQAMDYLRNSGAREFVSNLGGSVKQNPLPVALVGVGLAWLMAADKTSRSAMDTRIDAGSAKEKLGETVGNVRARADETREAARRRLQQARGSYQRVLQDQPLALGAIGVAVGAVLAAALPGTRKEEELLGEVGARVREKASEAASQQLDTAKRVTAEERARPQAR